MEVGNDTGIQPDYLRKKGNKKRQISAMENWRAKTVIIMLNHMER